MNQVGALPTPIKTLIALYKKRNHTILDINHLTCNTCNTWLTKPIYMKKNGYNVCEQCANAIEEECIQNISLEHLLEGGQYPCKFTAYGCKIFDALIKQHEEKCNYNFRCFCENVFENKHALFEHLKEKHSMETMTLIKPVADVTWNRVRMKTRPPVCLHAGETKLIFLVRLTNVWNLHVSMYNGGDIVRNIKYTIKVTCGNYHYTDHGSVTHTFLHPAGDTTLFIPNLHQSTYPFIDFKIYLDNYQDFEQIENMNETLIKDCECPICFETIIEYCYQCTNGHNVCLKCKAKISNCPNCRLAIGVCVNIRNLTRQIKKRCKYSENGCFVYNNISELQAHENKCPMKLRSCDLCKDLKFDTAAFVDHMLVKHEMQMLEDTLGVVKPGYIFYKECVYELDFKKTFDVIYTDTSVCTLESIIRRNMSLDGIKQRLGASTQLKVSWFVRLINRLNESVPPANYTLEFEAGGRRITRDGKVQENQHIRMNTEYTDFFPAITEDLPVTLKLSFLEI